MLRGFKFSTTGDYVLNGIGHIEFLETGHVMTNHKAKTTGESIDFFSKKTVRSKIIELTCQLFNKILSFIYFSPLFRTSITDNLEKLIHKPETVSICRPTTVNFVRVDVGLSNDASHSVECLLDNEDRLIIGIEPHPGNIKGLIFGTAKAHSISLKDRIVRYGFNYKHIKDLHEKFILINGAAGSSRVPTKRLFYSAYPDRGNSSFYKIHSLETTGNITDTEFYVIEFPLVDLFKKLRMLDLNLLKH